ncbi:alpha/beta fold hydrolase [Roseovarius arcticus]|uniref:alpha/beta fold hydrolase n=1 Tax=Roseovarius arcticus TaxID=2547404 RepID=UPI00111081B6|nr:alpha/beta hydrolase [Roseovarius arcticus]
MIVTITLLSLLTLFPFLREAIRPRMGKRARAEAPGSFAKLAQGITHYRWLGAGDGPVAVCVHGLTTPSFVWDPIAKGLGDLGYRVLVYDLYGRGYSDRPRGAQDCAFFTRQLAYLLADQGVTEGITLLGYSMGGTIAPTFAAERPAMIRHLVLLAPAGLGHDLGPASRLLAQTGLLGSWAMLSVYGRSMRRALEKDRSQKSSIPGIVDMQIAQLRHRGFLPAVLSSLRGALDADMEEAHRAVAQADIPTLAIWAEQDKVIPVAGRDTLAAWNPAAQQKVVAGADHSLPYTHDTEVTEILAAHLAR